MKLSIITINLNNKAGLLRTLASVESQVDRQFEHVIVDGASTDGSVEVIKEYAERHDNVRWISEPDTGIYNAMNKAVRMATADYLLYINSGDELYASDVVGKFNELECDEDLILGKVLCVNADGHIQREKGYKLCGSDLSFVGVYTRGIAHQSAFIKRTIQIKYPYDESYQIAADLHFFVKIIIIYNCSIRLFDLVVSNFYLEGISSSPKVLDEKAQIFNQMIPQRILIDYQNVTIDGLRIVKKLGEYDRFRKLVLALDDYLIRWYAFFKKLLRVILL